MGERHDDGLRQQRRSEGAGIRRLTGQILAWYAYGAGIDQALNRIQPSGDRVPSFGESANILGSHRYTGRRIGAETTD